MNTCEFLNESTPLRVILEPAFTITVPPVNVQVVQETVPSRVRVTPEAILTVQLLQTEPLFRVVLKLTLMSDWAAEEREAPVRRIKTSAERVGFIKWMFSNG